MHRIDAVEVNGSEKVIHFREEKRSEGDAATIQEMKQIIAQKNAVIERQTEYISELQEENTKLRSQIKMLTI